MTSRGLARRIEIQNFAQPCPNHSFIIASDRDRKLETQQLTRTRASKHTGANPFVCVLCVC